MATLERCARPYAAFSGGKDSLALLTLLSRMGRTDVPVLTQGDDLDWPDKQEYCERVVSQLGFEDYEYRRSERSALEQFAALDLGAEDGIRGTFSHVVRAYVRERSADGVLLGLRAGESAGRRWSRRVRGRIYKTVDGMTHGLPLGDWSGRDVFALILDAGVPYFHVYDHDDACPPHEIRMSWMLNPSFLHRGAAVWLRRHYPEQFDRLCAINPNLRAHA